MPAEVADSRQGLTYDGTAQARDETSWWSNTSWFAAPTGTVEPPPADTGAPSLEIKDVTTDKAQSPKPAPSVGGAISQSRLAGRSCHIPFGRSAPVDGSPIAESAIRTTAALVPGIGQTCDGLPLRHRLASNAVLGTSQCVGGWTFNLARWQWERIGEEAGADISEGISEDKHALAARRWGDGRDGLAVAVKRARLDDAALEGDGVAVTELETTDAEMKLSESEASIRRGAAGFASVGGLHKQKEALRRAIVVPLRHPELMRALGARPGRGALLHGPPGSGKTLLAAAIAAEAGVHLESINGAEAVAGQAAETKLRVAFANAETNAPSVLLIDEIDAIIPARDGISSENERQAGGRLMSLLDKLNASGAAVAVIATSSRPGALDAAIRRPGRLDMEVVFGALPQSEREEILRLGTAQMPLAPDLDLAAMAESMRGFVGADCTATITEAALECVSEAVTEAQAAVSGAELTEEDLQELAARIRVDPHHFAAALRRVRPSSLRGLCPEVPTASWKDVGGLISVKRQLRELIELPLKRPELLTKFGMRPARGALLYGPPGCGKTLLARAAAAQCGANFLSVRGPELLDKWLGQSEANVRDIFASARGAAPCIIFFDEMDAIAPRRSGGAGGSAAAGDSAAARVLNQLLAEMDGLSSGGASSHVFVLGATNRPEALDPALLRPGRMDALIKVPLPDEVGRLSVLRASLRKSPLAADVDLSALAAATPGFSGADLAELTRRAGRSAIRECIRSERGETETGSSATEDCITAAHLAAALECARCSVSAEQTAHFDEIERGLITGGIVETAVQKAVQVAAAKKSAELQQSLVQAAVSRATDSLAAQKITSLESELSESEKRIALLEQALVDAGLCVPPSISVDAVSSD